MAGPLQLPDPDELHAVPTVIRAVHGLTVFKSELYLFGAGLEEYVRVPFSPNGKTRVERFGEYTQAERLKFPKTKFAGEWRGLLFDEKGRRIIWDASMLQLALFFSKDLQLSSETTVPVDLLLPPADRMGEPSKTEVERARLKFIRAHKKVFGPRYTGLSKLPKNWMKGPGRTRYLMATKIVGFPITVLACDEDEPLTCLMERFCFLEGGPKLSADSVSGVGILASKRTILIGDAARHSVHLFQWNSCFDVRYLRSLNLPKSIEKMTSLQVDEEDRLWVTTGKWESRFDSNLYYWDKLDWAELK